MTFSDVLTRIFEMSGKAWVYLPRKRPWGLECESDIFESVEVPPELEDIPDAGIPDQAKLRGLMPVLPVATMQEIVFNAKAQRPHATQGDLFDAFAFYYEHDAFIEFVE
jgi:hypothetical protein